MRRDPIYLSTFTGRPPDEPSVLGEALNEVFIPLLQQQFPEIVDFWLPPEGCSYRIAVVSIRKAYPGHAKRVMMGVWSFLRQFMYTKWVIVVDDDIDARDWKDVMWAISTRMDPARDITLVENTPIDYLDFASPESGLGGKIGLDATNKWPPETQREWGRQIRMDDEIIAAVTEKWAELRPAGQRQADLEMSWMSDPNKVIPTSRIVLGLILAASALIAGGLAMSSERDVILKGRLAPDAIHNVSLELKGRIFYASVAQAEEYFFYKKLFLWEMFLIFGFIMLSFIWQRYKQTHARDRSAKDQR